MKIQPYSHEFKIHQVTPYQNNQIVIHIKRYSNPKSLYQSTSLSVSEYVWMFPNSTETANPSDLKFLGMIPLGMEKGLG